MSMLLLLLLLLRCIYQLYMGRGRTENRSLRKHKIWKPFFIKSSLLFIATTTEPPFKQLLKACVPLYNANAFTPFHTDLSKWKVIKLNFWRYLRTENQKLMNLNLPNKVCDMLHTSPLYVSLLVVWILKLELPCDFETRQTITKLAHFFAKQQIVLHFITTRNPPFATQFSSRLKFQQHC